MDPRIRPLDEEDYVRDKLFSGKNSSLRRYGALVLRDPSVWSLLKYELITSLLGAIPGALGLLLRRLFYPLLFKKAGKGVIFGRSVTIRNPENITIGDRAVIDDYCLIDARGAGDEGIVIGDETVLHRGSTVQAKIGPIQVGSHTDVGSGTNIISQGATYIGERVAIGGGCKIGGGSVQLELPAPRHETSPDHPNEFAARGQSRFSKGPVQIEARCILGRGAMVMDGAHVEEGSIIAAGVIVRERVPSETVVLPRDRLMMIPRAQFSGATATRFPEARPQQHPGTEPVGEVMAEGKLIPAIYRAIDEINEQLPPEKQLAKTLDTVLWGSPENLDSLALINLVVALEEIIEEEFGASLTIVDPSSISDGQFPFSSVRSLADHVNRLLAEFGK